MSGEIYVQDFAALETLFKRFYKPLRAYAFRFVNDNHMYHFFKRRSEMLIIFCCSFSWSF